MLTHRSPREYSTNTMARTNNGKFEDLTTTRGVLFIVFLLLFFYSGAKQITVELLIWLMIRNRRIYMLNFPVIILGMGSANERRRYFVTSSLVSWAHTQNDRCLLIDPPLLLTHWGRVTHICVGKLTIIGSDNGLSPGRRQAIIWTNAGILLIGPLGTNFSEIWIGIQTFSLKKILLKMSSANWRLFCFGLNVLNALLHRCCTAHAAVWHKKCAHDWNSFVNR